MSHRRSIQNWRRCREREECGASNDARCAGVLCREMLEMSRATHTSTNVKWQLEKRNGGGAVQMDGARRHTIHWYHSTGLYNSYTFVSPPLAFNHWKPSQFHTPAPPPKTQTKPNYAWRRGRLFAALSTPKTAKTAASNGENTHKSDESERKDRMVQQERHQKHGKRLHVEDSAVSFCSISVEINLNALRRI